MCLVCISAPSPKQSKTSFFIQRIRFYFASNILFACQLHWTCGNKLFGLSAFFLYFFSSPLSLTHFQSQKKRGKKETSFRKRHAFKETGGCISPPLFFSCNISVQHIICKSYIITLFEDKLQQSLFQLNRGISGKQANKPGSLGRKSEYLA